jgi:hypothetical protein
MRAVMAVLRAAGEFILVALRTAALFVIVSAQQDLPYGFLCVTDANKILRPPAWAHKAPGF